MPGQGREIRRRIKSIKSTRQITKAMEMVSAAKMRKAVQNVFASRPYATLAWGVVQEIALKIGAPRHPLLGGGSDASEGTHKTALLLITSNRGLSGSFNVNAINAAHEYVRGQSARGMAVDILVLGKKGRDAMAKAGYHIIAEFAKVDVTTRVEEIRPLVQILMSEYLKGVFARVVMVYTDFISTLTQKPRVRQLLPLIGEDLYLGVVNASLRDGERDITRHGGVNSRSESREIASIEEDSYLFEPTPSRVLDAMLPRIVEMQVYQAILESDASEHSARMLAMKNASEAAGDMIDELTLLYNQDRQAGITREIAEISAGKIAVER